MENKAWWDNLTDEQRDEYATLYPVETGALEGLPAVARDTSNRMVLAEMHAQAQIDLAELGPEPQKSTQTTAGPVLNPCGRSGTRRAAR